MKDPIVVAPDYWTVLVQWIALLGFLMVIILPAVLYRKLAKRFNKKAWLYFLLGLLVGVIALTIVHLYARLVHHFLPPTFSEGERYSWLFSMYAIGYLLVWTAYRLLLAFFLKTEKLEIGE